jgi:hypothetical protein
LCSGGAILKTIDGLLFVGSGIRNGKISGSGINIPDPQLFLWGSLDQPFEEKFAFCLKISVTVITLICITDVKPYFFVGVGGWGGIK